MGFYGAENVLATLAANMGTDFEPLIGIVDNRDNSHLELAAFAREHALTSMVFPCRSAIDADFFRSLHKFILNNHIDIVHSHGYKSDFYAEWPPLKPMLLSSPLAIRGSFPIGAERFMPKSIA
jgi:hypothetical protein